MMRLRTCGRFVALAACAVLTCLPTLAEDQPERHEGIFAKVSDPATLVVTHLNRHYYFHLLGVEPALGLDRTDPLEREATGFLTSLLQDKRVVLEVDPTVPDLEDWPDYSGYILLEDGTCLNAEVLRRGYGTVDKRSDFSRREEFMTYEKEAREQERGIWKIRKRLGQEMPGVPCVDGTIAFAGFCGVGNPEIIPESRVVPRYPWKAHRKGIEGRVILRAMVAKDGTVGQVAPVTSPDPLLSEAAVAAVQKWRYKPALKDGQPVDVYFTVIVEFTIEDR
jgi:TonB family protein